MNCTNRPFYLVITATFTLAAFSTVTNRATAQVQGFTSGSVVVSRVGTGGTGSTALTSAGTAVFLDQYSTTGAATQTPSYTVALPTAATGGNNSFVNSGSAVSEGALTLSTGGDYLTIGGYNATTTTTLVASTSDTTVQREVAVIGANGSINTNTTLGNLTTSAYNTGNIRSSVLQDPSGLATTPAPTIYTGGVSPVGTSGVYQTTYAATSSGTAVNSVNPINTRVVNLFNSSLFASTSGSTATSNGATAYDAGIYQVTAGTSNLFLDLGTAGGTKSPYDFAFSNNGLSLYVADSSAGLQKYISTTGKAGSYTLAYTSAASGLTGLTFDGNNTLYGVTPTSLLSFLDNSLGSTPSSTFTQTLLASAATNTAFRGVDFAPATATTPAPPGIVSAGIGFAVTGFGALLRRRKQSKAPDTATPEAAA